MCNEDAIELVRQAQAEVPGALDRLCDRWLPTVLGWTLRLGGPRIDAEDAAHDVFLVLFRRLGSLEEPRSFSSWLFGITRRVVAGHRRRAWVRRWLPGAVPDRTDPSLDPSDRAAQSDVADQVWAAIESLPGHQREVLVLCDLEERSDSEVAEMLGIPKNTVKSRLRRARAALRAQVSELATDLPAAEAAAGGPR
ncbi:MAG TPA: sigma-70 family RNA polymerase sigma factor [Deltaproteobacteria bacterium]|nr:sigma-70 family RNA polymerase sigma factor [Deltaproteobacteria bacterium]